MQEEMKIINEWLEHFNNNRSDPREITITTNAEGMRLINQAVLREGREIEGYTYDTYSLGIDMYGNVIGDEIDDDDQIIK